MDFDPVLIAFNEKFSALMGGLKLAMVDPRLIREQDVNARNQVFPVMDRLTQNVKGRGALESVPFCNWEKDLGFIMISGHHRRRAAIEAGLPVILVLFDEGLTKEQQRAKQVAHNALDGSDNLTVLAQMMEEIKDIQLRYESAYDLTAEQAKGTPLENLMVEMDELADAFRAVLIVFTQAKGDQVMEAVAAIEEAQKENPDFMGAFLEPRENLALFDKACREVAGHLNLHNNPMIFSAMAKLAMERLAQLKQPGGSA